MCGRFTREFTWRQVHEFLSLPLELLEQLGGAFTASYNVAPTQVSPVCRIGDGSDQARRAGTIAGRGLVPMEWGLRPAWMDKPAPAKSGAAKPDAPKPALAPINARSETVATRPMFRQAFRHRRCIVPVSGFYEWKKAGDRKIPQYIRLRGEPIMGLAGLWEPRHTHGDTASSSSATFTILTTRANEFMAPIHDRMPVILDPAMFEDWLTADEPDQRVFEPFSSDRMTAHAVSTRVNSPRNNDPSLVRPVEREGLFE